MELADQWLSGPTVAGPVCVAQHNTELGGGLFLPGAMGGFGGDAAVASDGVVPEPGASWRQSEEAV